VAELTAIPVGFVGMPTVKRRHAGNGSHGQAEKTVGDSFIAMIAGRHIMGCSVNRSH